MMQLIVPTDFSKPADQAIAFAADLAIRTGSRMLLLHILPNVGPTLGRVTTENWKAQMEEEATMALQHLKAPLEERGINVSVSVIHDTTVAEALEDFTPTFPQTLVVMGTKGASGLKKMLLGSNTVDVINQCCMPVLVIPENAGIGPIDTLIFATDLKHTQQNLEALLPFAKTLQASIRIVHVPQAGSRNLDVMDAQMLQQIAGDVPVSFETIEGADLEETLEQYKVDKPAALLAMFTHETSFFDQLFQPSLVREIAWHGKVPLLVIKNK